METFDKYMGVILVLILLFSFSLVYRSGKAVVSDDVKASNLIVIEKKIYQCHQVEVGK